MEVERILISQLRDDYLIILILTGVLTTVNIIPLKQLCCTFTVLVNRLIINVFNIRLGELCCRLLLLPVWQAPLGVCSAKRRHQSPEWTILSHSYRLIQWEIVWSQVLLNSLHPRSSRTSTAEQCLTLTCLSSWFVVSGLVQHLDLVHVECANEILFYIFILFGSSLVGPFLFIMCILTVSVYIFIHLGW